MNLEKCFGRVFISGTLTMLGLFLCFWPDSLTLSQAFGVTSMVVAGWVWGQSNES